VVGPLRVIVGALPLLWHEVQVETFIPEKPAMPLLLAIAGNGAKSAASVTRTIHEILFKLRVRRWRLFRIGTATDPAAT
jgi:hypothetical protein